MKRVTKDEQIQCLIAAVHALADACTMIGDKHSDRQKDWDSNGYTDSVYLNRGLSKANSKLKEAGLNINLFERPKNEN